MTNSPNNSSPAAPDRGLGYHPERKTSTPPLEESGSSDYTEGQRPEYTLRASSLRSSPPLAPPPCGGAWTTELARKHARTLKRKRGAQSRAYTGGAQDAQEAGIAEECQEFYKRVDTALSDVAQMQTEMLRLVANSDDLLRELGAILRNMR